MSLTVKKVDRYIRAGERRRYADGGRDGVRGLYLCVVAKNSASWQFRFQLDKKQSWMGLGSAVSVISDLNLDQARAKAKAEREKLRDEINPLEHRRAEHKAREEAAKAAVTHTFKQVAEAYIRNNRDGWTNAKHAEQWARSLEKFVYPIIGDLDVAKIEVAHILQVFEQPIDGDSFWKKRHVTAQRVRNRIELILEAAATHGKRPQTAKNPAQLKVLKAALPKLPKGEKKHHANIAYDDLSGFMTELRKHNYVVAKALEFTILTVARTDETLGATWDEIDLKEAVWTIPAKRMKKRKKAHWVALTPAAIRLLNSLPREENNPFVFIGRAGGRLGENAMINFLHKQLKRSETMHGFRSSFKTWGEDTGKDKTAVEFCMSHSVGDQTENSYRRGDPMTKIRRKLLNAWARFCNTPPKGRAAAPKDKASDNVVVPMRQGARAA